MSGVALAGVYRWVDENGKVVYSQTPPPESVKSEKIEVNAPPPATRSPQEIQEKEAASVDTGNEGNPALDAELRRKYCEKGRKNLEVLQNAKPGMGFVTEDKKLIRLDADEIAVKIKESESVIKAYCD
ncbi:DUF4124 domain-containing protein [Thiolapillus brandeum]|nr:DUF4124 domain-containing protein [Thiolapillus brandeum]